MSRHHAFLMIRTRAFVANHSKLVTTGHPAGCDAAGMTTSAVARSDARRTAPPGASRPVRGSALAAVMVGALGVVFGDIGTSPLYALQVVFSLNGGVVRPTPGDVHGVVSLVFWAITLIVSIKYLALVLRADNQGGRDPGPHGARAAGDGERARPHWGAGLARRLRCRAVLRRQRHHAGHLGAVGRRGPRGRGTCPVGARRAVGAGHPLRPLRRPALGHRRRRARLRTGDDRLVRRDRRCGRRRGGGASGHRSRAVAHLCRRVHRRPSGRCLRRHGRRHARDHRRRGALCRHGPLRAPADPPRLVRARVPGAHAELPRSIRA